MYWVTSLVLCLIFSQVQCDHHHGQYVFVVQEQKEFISCISNPVNDVCPIDHKVPNGTVFTPYTNRKTLLQVFKGGEAILQRAGGNESCINASNIFQCSKMFYTCKPDLKYVYLDSSKAYRSCMYARQECAAAPKLNGAMLDVLLPCNSFKNASLRTFNRFLLTCMDYPNEANHTCPRRNYKVPSFWNYTDVDKTYGEVQRLLNQNNITKNCSDSVLEAICKINTPACTYDENYLVSLIGKKKCLEIMGCLDAANNANLTAKATELCNNLPDEDTAKKIPIHNVTGMATTPPNTGEDSTTGPHTTSLNTTATSTTETSTTCCGASKLYSISHILVIFWVFLANLAK